MKVPERKKLNLGVTKSQKIHRFFFFFVGFRKTYIFVCIKLNFFLTFFLSLSDLFPWGYNWKKTRPSATMNPIIRKWVQYQVNHTPVAYKFVN